MRGWIAGVLAAILSGVIIWALTTYGPKYFERPPTPPPVDNSLHVKCSGIPTTVPPGGSSEITVSVLRQGLPVENATVKIEVGGGAFPASSLVTTAGGSTFSDGIVRTVWKAPMPAAATYEFRATADTSDGAEGVATCGIGVSG